MRGGVLVASSWNSPLGHVGYFSTEYGVDGSPQPRAPSEARCLRLMLELVGKRPVRLTEISQQSPNLRLRTRLSYRCRPPLTRWGDDPLH
jgi:hypothetical protein